MVAPFAIASTDVSTAVRARELYDRFSEYKCEAAIRHYRKELEASLEEAEAVFVECVKFLAIKAVAPETNPAPSDALDMMWHAFIIQTKEYAEFCEDFAGRFLHHATSRAPRSNAYNDTLQTYREAFGVEHPIWVTPLRERVPSVMPGDGDCEPCRISGWCSEPD